MTFLNTVLKHKIILSL